MSQTDSKQDFVSDESETDFTLNNETEANSEEIENLPVESIGSYARIDAPPDEKDSSSSDYSPSKA